MVLIVTMMSYFHNDMEPISLLACRSLAYTMLSFAWIYIVGLHSSQGIEHLKETSCQFTSRLAPLLYSPLWIACLFLPAAICGLTYQYMRLFHPLVMDSSPTLTYQPFTAVQEPPSIQPEPSDEEVFRMARQNSGAFKPSLTPIEEQV
jgi:hypothetical protein